MSSFIADYFKLNINTSEFENEGTFTIKFDEKSYQPFLLFFNKEEKLVLKIPINKSINYDFTKEKEHDLLISNSIGLRFDKNSSVSFDIFKEKLDKLISNEQKIEYYENTQKIKFYGCQNENKEWDGKVSEYFNNRKNSIKFDGEMEDDEYASGTFYNKEGTIQVKINNIVDNIPNGFITIFIHENKYNVNYDSINNFDNLRLEDDEFVNQLCKNHFGIDFMTKINFTNTISSNRDYILLQNIKLLQTKIDKIDEKLNQRYKGVFGIIKWILGF